MTERRPDVELTIDELILEGVSDLHRRRVVAAIERELGRLVRAGDRRGPAGLARGGGRGGRRVTLPDRSFSIGAERDPEAIGAQVARSLWAACRPADSAAARSAPPEADSRHRSTPPPAPSRQEEPR